MISGKIKVTNKVRLAAIALRFICAFAPHDTFAAPPSKADPVKATESRIDHYFSDPPSPETFRALSGMGLPGGATTLDNDPAARWWSATSTEDKELLHRLFPRVDTSTQYWYPDFGACRAEAPLQQLKERVARLGAQHPYVAQWLRVEGAVLSACATGRDRDTIASALPPALGDTDPAIALLEKQDRAYQQAALLFYQGDNAGALAGFEAIADDHASPNRALAAYMVLAIRAGSRADGPEQSHPSDSVVLPPEQSLKAIQAALADPSLQSIHPMAASLIGWIGASVQDTRTRSAQLDEATTSLMAPTDRLNHCPECLQRYEVALSDIEYLRRNVFYSKSDNPDWILTGKLPEDYATSAALAALARKEPLAAWIAFPADEYRRRAWVVAAAAPHSDVVRAYLDRMSGNDSIDNPWLHENPDIAAATLSKLVDDEIARLNANADDEQAAAALSYDFYNLVRHLLMDTKDRRAQFNTALQRLQEFPYKETITFDRAVDDGLQYLITEGRLAEARQLRDTLKLDGPEGRLHPYTSSAGALLVLAEDEDHLVRVMNSAVSYPREYLNHVSTAELWRLAARGDLDHDQRTLVVRAAWSRDYALGNTISSEHDRLLRQLAPEITAGWRTPVGHDVRPDDISIARDVLKSPGLNTVIESFSRMPDDKNSDATATLTGLDHYNHNDNNWWCPLETARHDAALDDAIVGSFSLYDDELRTVRLATWRQRFPHLLDRALLNSYLFRNIDQSELTRLSKVECAPQFLSERVIAWVRRTGSSGSRAGQAEALADAVSATRWGCNRAGSHALYSQEAFRLLHSLFPESAEAKRTPYWFN